MSTTSNQTGICVVCNKKVFALERTSVDGKVFHQDCLRCKKCKTKLNSGNLGKFGDSYYCKTHMMQEFKLKGRYEEQKPVEKKEEKKEEEKKEETTQTEEKQE